MYSLKRGVNIGRWLCHGNSPLAERENWLTRDDIHQIRDIGFDHVRIALKEIYFWDEEGTLNPKAITILRRGLDWVMESGLNASVNLHILRSHYFNDYQTPALFSSAEAQQRFYGFWLQLSEKLNDYSTERLAYEYLNEPVAPENQHWNKVHLSAYQLLRAKEPERVLILGSNLWNQTRTFADLQIPEDRSMILDFHFYEPLLVSHYRAPWVKMAMVPFKNQYPGRPLNMPSWLFGLYTNLRPGIMPMHKKDAWHENDYFDRQTILNRVNRAVNVAKKHGLPLNCGEFGVYSPPDGSFPQAGFKWLRDVLLVYQELGISWTIWTLGKGDDSFSIINAKGEENPVMKVVREFL